MSILSFLAALSSAIIDYRMSSWWRDNFERYEALGCLFVLLTPFVFGVLYAIDIAVSLYVLRNIFGGEYTMKFWLIVYIVILIKFLIIVFVENGNSIFRAVSSENHEKQTIPLNQKISLYHDKYPLTCFEIYKGRGIKYGVTFDDLECVMEQSMVKQVEVKSLTIYEKNDSEDFLKQKIENFKADAWNKSERRHKEKFNKRINYIKSTYKRVYDAIDKYPFRYTTQYEYDYRYILLSQMSEAELRLLNDVFNRIDLLDTYKKQYSLAYEAFKRDGILKEGCVRSSNYLSWVNESKWKNKEDELQRVKYEEEQKLKAVCNEVIQRWNHCKKMIEEMDMKRIDPLKNRLWNPIKCGNYSSYCKDERISSLRDNEDLLTRVKEFERKLASVLHPVAYFVMETRDVDIFHVTEQEWKKEDEDPINNAMYLQKHYVKGFDQFFRTPERWTLEFALDVLQHSDEIKRTHVNMVENERKIFIAKSICKDYRLGFMHFFPSVKGWTLDFAEQVLEKMDEIRNIDSKFKQEEEDMSEAQHLSFFYKKGFEHYFPHFHGWTKDFVKSVLSRKRDIISKNNELVQQEQNRLIERQEEKEFSIKVSYLERKVADWHVTQYGIRHHYIYDYLKTKAVRNATESEWDIRNLIWSFKNDPNKMNKYSYSEALNRIVDDYERILEDTFGGYLTNLTLVCVPSSTAANNERRWKAFCERVCRDLRLQNGYEHIRVVRDAIPKHLGGDGQMELSVDAGFFKRKCVVLCDDLITSGRSLDRMKTLLESYGAKVICAFTIGKTISE